MIKIPKFIKILVVLIFLIAILAVAWRCNNIATQPKHEYTILIEEACDIYGYEYTMAMVIPASAGGYSYRLTNDKDDVEIDVIIENRECYICVTNYIFSSDEKATGIKEHLDVIMYIGNYFSQTYSKAEVLEFLNDESIYSDRDAFQRLTYDKQGGTLLYNVNPAYGSLEDYKEGDAMTEDLIITF